MVRQQRGGSVFFLAVILLMLILIGLFTALYLVGEERQATFHIVKTLRATAIAEALKGFIVAQVNSSPWNRRFYLLDARSRPIKVDDDELPEIFYPFSHDDPLFFDLIESEDKPHVEFTGVIKDLSALARRYRIWIEVSYMGHRLTFSFDKSFSEDLLGALNRDPDTLTKDTGEQDVARTNPLTGITDGDMMIDRIKDDALVPSKWSSTENLWAEFEKYRRQEPLRYLKPELPLDMVIP